MKLIHLTLLLIIMLTINCKTDKESSLKQPLIKLHKNILPYGLNEEKLIDNPNEKKLSIKLIIEKSDTITKEHIKLFVKNSMNYYIEKYNMRNSYENNQINLFVFTSLEKASSGMGQWVAQASFHSKRIDENIKIDEIQFNSLNELKVEKWGLSYEQRKQIWSEILKAEDQARITSNQLRPLTGNESKKYIIEKLEIEEEFKKYNKKKLLENHQIDSSILDSISNEGLNNGWSF